MTSGTSGEWVRQGTPRDDNADWNEEQSEYGTAISPTEWDDYSSEQSVPVVAPRTQVPEGVPTAASPGSPAERNQDLVPGEEPVSEDGYGSDVTYGVVEDDPAGDHGDNGQEPAPLNVAGHTGATAVISAPVSPNEVDPVTHYSPVEVEDQEMTRPRPIVPEASMATVGAASPADDDESPEPFTAAVTPEHTASPDEEAVAHDDDDEEAVAHDDDSASDDDTAFVDAPEAGGERHVEAAEYLAVDPVTVPLETTDAPSSDDAVNRDADAEEIDDRPAGDSVIAEDSSDSDAVAQDPELAEEEPSQLVDDDETEATQVVPLVTSDAVAPAAADSAVPEGLYPADGTEHTAVFEEGAYPDVDVEEERLQARLEAERQARDQRLGAVPTSTDNASREDAGPARVTTDRFFPSFALFVLRIVTAAILGVTSWQILGTGVDETANFLGGYPLIPEPRLVAWILGFTLGALALLLVIGLLQRVVGILLLVISAASLALIRWGSFSIFRPGVESFVGDRDLLLAAIGLLLLGLGGGKWGVDGAFRGTRAASKAERED